jgi:hypothetical protein
LRGDDRITWSRHRIRQLAAVLDDEPFENHQRDTEVKHLGIRFRGVPTPAELLLFDEIAVYTFGTNSQSNSAQDEAALGYLAERGIVFGAAKFVENAEAHRAFKIAHDHVLKGLQSVRDILERPSSQPPQPWPSEAERQRATREVLDALESFAVLPCRHAVERMPAYRPATIVRSSNALPEPEGASLVLEVVMRQMPLPDPDTPLEAILDFRADEAAMLALRRLRSWMNGIGRLTLKPYEIEEGLLTLNDQYREHMRLHQMKHHNGVLRTLVTISLDVAEQLAHLKFKAAFEATLVLQQRRLALTEAEMVAPGRDVAYIVRAQDAFS